MHVFVIYPQIPPVFKHYIYEFKLQEHDIASVNTNVISWMMVSIMPLHGAIITRTLVIYPSLFLSQSISLSFTLSHYLSSYPTLSVSLFCLSVYYLPRFLSLLFIHITLKLDIYFI